MTVFAYSIATADGRVHYRRVGPKVFTLLPHDPVALATTHPTFALKDAWLRTNAPRQESSARRVLRGLAATAAAETPQAPAERPSSTSLARSSRRMVSASSGRLAKRRA